MVLIVNAEGGENDLNSTTEDNFQNMWNCWTKHEGENDVHYFWKCSASFYEIKKCAAFSFLMNIN